MPEPRIAMVAGEASGDLLAGLVLDGLLIRWPKLAASGIGDPHMARRGFKAEHFALNHPAGRLGKRLTLRVRDVMRAGADNPVVLLTASATELLSTITRLQAGAASIVDKKGRFLGLVTDFDIRRTLEAGGDFRTRKIASIMNAKPATIEPDALAAEAVDLMEDRRTPFNVLPVVDKKGRSVGMIQIHDLRASIRISQQIRTSPNRN